MKILKEKAGLILVEAIMAVSMMGIGVVILGSIVSSGVDNLSLSRDYITAQNLATEGLEIIKGVRDTNWLLKPNDRKCWLRVSPDSACTNIVYEKSYIPLKLSDERNYLSEQTKPFDLSTGIEYPKYRLYTKDGFYTHEASGADATEFYRSINVLNVDNSNYDFATFEIKVQWRSGSKIREVKRVFTMYNSL